MPPPSLRKTRASKTQSIDVEETTFVHFPSNFLKSEGVGEEIWPATDKLLFPAAEERLTPRGSLTCVTQGAGHILQGLQNILTAKSLMEKVNAEDLKKKLEEKDRVLMTERMMWEAKFKSLEEAKLRELADSKIENDALRLEIEVITAGSEVLKKEKEDLMGDYAAAELTGQAKMAYKVYFGLADREACKESVDWYVANLGSMKDLEEKREDPSKEATASTADSPTVAEPQDGEGASKGGDGTAVIQASSL